MDLRILGQRLAAMRIKAGYSSQDSLSKTLKDKNITISVRAISDYETGKGNPGVKELNDLSDICKSGTEYLFETKIPEDFQNPEDRKWHEMLQEILDGGASIGDKWAAGIKANIESLFESTIRDLQAERKEESRKAKKQRFSKGRARERILSAVKR